MRRCFFVGVLLAVLIMGTQTVSATELAGGLMEPEVVAVPERAYSEDVINPERITEIENSDPQTDKWDKYSSKYYYNQLEEKYKATWDALDVVCKSYFDGSRDVSGYTDSVSLPEGITLDELSEFWQLYIFSNPQYYFLKNGFSYSYRENKQNPLSVKLGIYKAFFEGENRVQATEKVENQLTTWQEEIDACVTDEAKLQKIQELICAKVTYNYDAANRRVDEEISFSQSPYSVFCSDSTVCAGYADTFYMLCNASGIDAISVTSPGHQWNKARVNGSWYNFDVTWDDNSTDSSGYQVYRYHGRSDEMYDVDMNSGSVSNIENHQEEEFWDGYIPACNLDTNPTGNWSVPGIFASASGQTANPMIAVTYENDKIMVSISCETTGANIYYTTDGTKPALAETKSIKYSGAFAAKEDTHIRAVAIKDTYFDSMIAGRTVGLEKYPITYVLGGGENHAGNPQYYTVRDEFTLQAPSKKGYVFDGWFCDEEYHEKVLAIEKGNIGPLAFYAKWVPITYTIRYLANGASAGTMSAVTTGEYDAECSLKTNAYTKSGYIFDGWNTKADGSGIEFEDNQKVINLCDTQGGNVDLYAQWIPITYVIVFDGNGATGGETGTLICNYDDTYEILLNGYEKEGYTFTGWNSKEDGSGTYYAEREEVHNLSATEKETITLYAQWAANIYKVKFDGNGATDGAMSVLTDLKRGKSYVLSANEYKCTGYIFSGWNTRADGSGDSYADGATIYNPNTGNKDTITLYAKWAPITYCITFNGNGATGGATGALTACKYDNNYALPASNFVREGHTFVGWNTKANGSGTAYANKATVRNLANAQGSVITLYAQWKVNSYTIKFDGNKAEKGSVPSMSELLYGKAYSLSANKYKRTGYRFTGWNTAKNGKGVSYKNKETLQSLTSVDGGVVVLYAQWKANTYTVKFHGNGATSGSMKKMKNRMYDKKFKLSANKFKRKGYKFVGWNTKKNGKGKIYKNKAKVKNLTSKNGKTVTLYAQWKKL